MALWKTLTRKFVKLAALNVVALLVWWLLRASPSPANVLVVWTFVGLAGLLDLGWIAIGVYAFARARRASR